MATALILSWLLAPLRLLYLRGPAWSGWGFWEGRPPDDICAELTHVDARHWRDDLSGPAACDDLVDRKFQAFAIGIAAVMAMTMTIAVCAQTIHYCCTVRPLLNHVDSIVSKAVRRDSRSVKSRPSSDDSDAN